MGNRRTAWRHVQRDRVFPKGRNSGHGKRWVAPEVVAGGLVVSHPSEQGRNLSAGETGGAPEAGAGGLVVSHPRGQGRNLSAERQEACQRLVQACWLFPTPTPADTLLTGGGSIPARQDGRISGFRQAVFGGRCVLETKRFLR